ncbi:MAG: polysaccharide deacetylase family protein [Planctomycetaceae bacterium]|nr:polysaccharide deacetylase family protein [Planctomycetaceae bacterium]
MNQPEKPIASLSLDLDNKWSYMKTHGDAGWELYPSYLDTVVPRFLRVLHEQQLKMTVFVVGQDASREENFEALASISSAGHEIGNHSFNHEPWLHLYSEQQLVSELAKTEDHLERVTGHCPIGFRGPGFSFTDTLLKILVRRGYKYDGSTFPTFLGPLARMYYFLSTRLDKSQREERKELFGQFREGFRQLRPFQWKFREGELTEIPVTTMPIFKVPIHASYVLYLAQYSPMAARTYWRFALMMCRMNKVAPSLLLHPLDFMGCDDDSDLAFFPAMGRPAEPKVELVAWMIEQMSRHYDVRPMKDHAAAVAQQATTSGSDSAPPSVSSVAPGRTPTF